MSKSLDIRFEWPIIGHLHVTSYLQHCVATDTVSHAYVFAGPAHIGKSAVARQFAYSLLCQHRLELESGNAVPCGQCQSCVQATRNVHPDFFWLKREENEKTEKVRKNISIDQVRSLQEKLSLHTFFQGYKVAVIDEAETLSTEAANAILKTLEEPTAKTVIILLVTHQSALPKTVLSRCQVLHFLPVPNEIILKQLVGTGVELKKAKAFTSAAAGRPGIALQYAEHPDEFDTTEAIAKKFLTVLRSDIATRFKIVGEMATLGLDTIQARLQTWTEIVRDIVLLQWSVSGLITHATLMTELQTLADQYSGPALLKLLKSLNDSQVLLEANVNPKLLLEQLVLTF